MADDDSNETEHRHRLWWDVRRVPCAVQSVCSTYARKLISFYLPPSRLLVPIADIWGSARWADRLIYLKTVSETRAQLTLGGQ